MTFAPGDKVRIGEETGVVLRVIPQRPEQDWPEALVRWENGTKERISINDLEKA